MWAAGVIELGLQPAYFWSLLPVHFDRLCRAHRARERRADRRFGLMASIFANAHRDRKIRPTPFTIEDFTGENRPAAQLYDIRGQLDPAVAARRYLDGLQASDPTAEITMSAAVLSALGARSGTWSKLGTREGLVLPLSVTKVMNGWRPEHDKR